MADPLREGGAEKSKRRKSGCLTVIASVFAALVIFGFVGGLIAHHKSGLVDSAFAPVIEALDRYKTANGRYPDKLDALVPTYLSALPTCPDSHRPGGGYSPDPMSGEYSLGCYTFVFNKRVYDSRIKQWKSGD